MVRAQSFRAQGHFLGYEGRAGNPSNFDANYCYALGFAAAAFVQHGLTGYICSIQNLSCPVDEWEVSGVPITLLLHIEERSGVPKPVIKKMLVDLTTQPFQLFKQHRKFWETNDCYRYPGPIQFIGDSELVDSHLISLEVAKKQYI